MGWRFYTAKEFAKLNAADEARRQRSRGAPRFVYPIQEQLQAVLHKVPADRQGFARAMVWMKKLSPKQLAAAQRFVDRAKAA